MAFDRPTLAEIAERISSDIETRLPSIGGLLRRSPLKILARVLAGAVHSLYGYINIQAEQLFATTADSGGLDTIGAEYGVNRTAASTATGSAVATGTATTTIPEGTEIQSSAGEVYEVDEDFDIGVGGTVTITFTAQIAGADGNDDGGISLSFVSPISGVDSSVTVSADGISGGTDNESDDNYRERVLLRKRRPPHGGCEYDYESWAKEVSGVTRVWLYPQITGNGTLSLAFTRDDDDNALPNLTQRQAVEDYIIEHIDPSTGETTGIPVAIEAGFFVQALSWKDMDLSIEIYPNTQTVKDNVETELENLVYEEGGPAQVLYLSKISEAISNAAGEVRHRILSPTADVSATFSEVHRLGTITWSDYS